jgi:hypothetical protein
MLYCDTAGLKVDIGEKKSAGTAHAGDIPYREWGRGLVTTAMPVPSLGGTEFFLEWRNILPLYRPPYR